MPGVGYVALFFFLAVGAASLFTFVGCAVWSSTRLQERLELYRTELLKKVAEQPGEGGRQVLLLLREEQQRKHAERRHGLLLGGLVTAAVGCALMVMLGGIHAPNFAGVGIGLIPFLIGASMFFFALVALRPSGTPDGIPSGSADPGAPPEGGSASLSSR